MSTEPKKSSCFAIGGAGCLIILILIVAGAGIVWWQFGPQIQQTMEDAKTGDEERTKALAMLRFNPQVDIISIDEANRTVTFKLKTSEETVTATFAALSAGRMTVVGGKIQGLDEPPAEAPPPAAPQL